MDVQAFPVTQGTEHPASNLGLGSVMLQSSDGGRRSSAADPHARNWYMGPGPGLFASEQVGSGAGAEGTLSSQPSDSFGGAAGGLMLQQVVCTSTVGQRQNLHSISGNGEIVGTDRSLHDS